MSRDQYVKTWERKNVELSFNCFQLSSEEHLRPRRSGEGKLHDGKGVVFKIDLLCLHAEYDSVLHRETLGAWWDRYYPLTNFLTPSCQRPHVDMYQNDKNCMLGKVLCVRLFIIMSSSTYRVWLCITSWNPETLSENQLYIMVYQRFLETSGKVNRGRTIPLIWKSTGPIGTIVHTHTGLWQWECLTGRGR